MATADTTETEFVRWFRQLGRALGPDIFDMAAFEAILAEHAPMEIMDPDGPDRSYCVRCIDDSLDWLERQTYPCRTLKIIAMPFREFEGHRDEWRIE